MAIEVLLWCKEFLFACYICPKCGLLTFGRATSYHAQVHGSQDTYWSPESMNNPNLARNK